MANIVIIEDTPANLELMCYLLYTFGHRVITAVNGHEGLELVRRTAPELIICDVHLPSMDGYEVARRLKSDPALSAIPLLAVTASVAAGGRGKRLEAGFDGYIGKPIEPKTFVSEVELFLSVDKALPLRQPIRVIPSFDEIRPMRGKILIVDESEVNLELFRNMLTPLGYEVYLTRSASEGYKQACRSKPDLILSNLPIMDEDGCALLQRIGMNAQLAAIPFIFNNSTIRGKVERGIAQQLGEKRFLAHPIKSTMLLDEIEAVLAKRQR